jgi:hypothetical protein
MLTVNKIINTTENKIGALHVGSVGTSNFLFEFGRKYDEFRDHSFREHQRTFREHSRNILETFREHSGNIQGTFREYSVNIQGTFREH